MPSVIFSHSLTGLASQRGAFIPGTGASEATCDATAAETSVLDLHRRQSSAAPAWSAAAAVSSADGAASTSRWLSFTGFTPPAPAIQAPPCATHGRWLYVMINLFHQLPFCIPPSSLCSSSNRFAPVQNRGQPEGKVAYADIVIILAGTTQQNVFITDVVACAVSHPLQARRSLL